MVDINLLRSELWELLGGRDGVSGIVTIKDDAMRMGLLEDSIRSAIRRSSVGYYNGCLYFFGGKLYESATFEEWQNMLTDLLFDDVKIPKKDYGHVSYMCQRFTVLAKSRRLRVNNNLMVFRNGVLDTETMEFSSVFDKKFVQMWSVNYDYSPGASTFMWKQFIEQVLPDEHYRRVLQMFLGASFVERSKVKIEHLLILLGKGANGKGVVNQVIKGVMGDYMSQESVVNLCDRGLTGMASLARINGKKLNFGTEMANSDFRRKDAKLKALVSGEAVTARMLYGQPFEARDIPLLMSSANMIPVFDTGDEALVRRIYPIPFNIVIPPERRNPCLAQEMAAEYAGVFNWVMEGRRLFVENGYKLPEETQLKKILSAKKSEYDTALAFMAKRGYRPCIEGVDLAPRNSVNAKALYDDYVDWCNANALEVKSKMAFYSSLDKEGFVRARHSGGMVYYVFGAITLNTFAKDARRLREERAKKKAPKSVIMWIDGKAYVSSLAALAGYAGVGFTSVQTLNNKGLFEAYKKGWREKVLFEVDGCIDVLRDLKVLATDEEKELHRRLQKELKYMRNVFNQRMEYHGLPYRKYSREDQIDDSVVVVPDDITIDEIVERARKEYDFKGVIRTDSPGAFGRGGKGYYDDVDDIPTEEEKKAFYQKAKPHKTKRNE